MTGIVPAGFGGFGGFGGITWRSGFGRSARSRVDASTPRKPPLMVDAFTEPHGDEVGWLPPELAEMKTTPSRPRSRPLPPVLVVDSWTTMDQAVAAYGAVPQIRGGAWGGGSDDRLPLRSSLGAQFNAPLHHSMRGDSRRSGGRTAEIPHCPQLSANLLAWSALDGPQLSWMLESAPPRERRLARACPRRAVTDLDLDLDLDLGGDETCYLWPLTHSNAQHLPTQGCYAKGSSPDRLPKRRLPLGPRRRRRGRLRYP